ncbi:hypothetical protein H4R18_004660 [Coemansia javaensis]|uniref:Uncharacterized protein n=1 Tax=Coemansia javaensis TaxID=2761396 RepID=A0A9W8H8S4_9FUNG|nr:hypothetical protein H4R18_004660 [Coemansia javaensis]
MSDDELVAILATDSGIDSFVKTHGTAAILFHRDCYTDASSLVDQALGKFTNGKIATVDISIGSIGKVNKYPEMAETQDANAILVVGYDGGRPCDACIISGGQLTKLAT